MSSKSLNNFIFIFTASVTGLRHTQSVKNSRSISAPSRTQVTLQPLSAITGSTNVLSSIPDSDPELELEVRSLLTKLCLSYNVSYCCCCLKKIGSHQICFN